MRLLRSVPCLLAILAAHMSFCAAKGEPKISKTAFTSLPTSFFYFEDSPIIISHDSKAGVIWRSEDDGATWNKIDGIPDGSAWDVWEHPFDKKRAYVLSDTKKHWKTEDQGKTWQTWEAPAPPSFKQVQLAFHAEKFGFVIYHGRICEGSIFSCQEASYYTKDNFDGDAKLLLHKAHGCMFARSTEAFKKGTEYTVLCIVESETSTSPAKRKLLSSDDWFSDKEKALQPKLDGFRTYEGVAGVAAVQKFLIAAVKGSGSDEMLLFVSDDAVNWARAEFPSDHGGVHEDAYTILESTPYSIQVDVLTTKKTNAVGSLFTSNSNGTYFTRNLKDTNRNMEGKVDFEKIKGIEGIVMANKIDNVEEVEADRRATKKIQSLISFDDGRTWNALKDDKGNELHFHSVTNLHNGGRVFSSPAPGIVMGVGSASKYLLPYTECDLYVSDDAGLTWRLARKEAHKYEFGDQGSILVAIYDEDTTDIMAYSTNHGKDWTEFDLGMKVRARLLTTTPDSTTRKFTLVASAVGDNPDGKQFVFSIDLAGITDRKCKLDEGNEKDGDYEKWYARLDPEGKPDCLMGHKQFFWRRKADADCYIGSKYDERAVEEEKCACTEEDYECDFNFIKKDNKCELEGPLAAPEGACKDPKDKYMGSSGYRLIPGNTCDKENGEVMDEKIERQCGETVAPPTSGKITNQATTFAAQKVIEYYYLERSTSSSGTDETILMRTSENEVHLSNDHGKTWKQILEKEQIVAIYPNPYFHDMVYFVTASTTVHYTTNRGSSFSTFKTLNKPNMKEQRIIDFHPSQKDSFIWLGQKDCEQSDSKGCHIIAYATKDGGDSWEALLSWVRRCSWIPDRLDLDKPGSRIYCEHYRKDGITGDLELVSSDDLFKTKKIAFPEIIGYATMEEFILIAAINEDGTSLKLDASVDGTTFADAKFPANFHVSHQQAYTVLDSITHAVFLHVSVNTQLGSEYGTLLKSNSNGTSYVLSLNYVNRDGRGYVDFEKMQGLEGVAIVNIVTNSDETVDGAKKKLRSMITHNDGGEWAYLVPPPRDLEGKPFSCEGKIESCSLSLHGYTERRDTRDTYSSASAVGLMIGVGNVGDVLKSKGDCDTFLTRDGGVSWVEIHKGPYMWEYGDQGSIIVIVDETQPTDEVLYTLNEGKTWELYKFSEDKMTIEDISTVPSDTSRNFLLWAKPGGRGEKYITINLDFTGLTNQQCQYGADGPGEDFELWAPSHPLQESDCLFGHTEQYKRKKLDHLCYIGPKIVQPHKRLDNCSCTRQDYECDFNYERQLDGVCKLVAGTDKPDHSLDCVKNKNLLEYFEPTGYRRLPLTTCQDGHEFDKTLKAIPCPGKENEFKKKRGGLGGFGVFFIVIISFGMAGSLGYVLWNRWSGKFGQIRLGDDSAGGQSPLVKYPIIIVSAIIAVASAIPVIVGTVYHAIASRLQRKPRYTSRGQFARGDYSTVTNDEGELLGDDSDDEV